MYVVYVCVYMASKYEYVRRPLYTRDFNASQLDDIVARILAK